MIITRLVLVVSILLTTVLTASGIVAPLFGGLLWVIWGVLALGVGTSACVVLSAAFRNTFFAYPKNSHRGVWAFILVIVAILGSFLFAFISGILLPFGFLGVLGYAAYLVGRPFDVTPSS